MIKYKNKNLVIASVGDRSLHNFWMPDRDKNYDLFLINYGQKSYKNDCNFYLEKKGFKYNLIYEAFENNPHLYDYKYVWMPDDDIYIEPEDIEKLFDVVEEYNLWISQPSILGWYGLKVTLHNIDTKIRFTNYVEIMCPCFESNSLKKCISTFIENESGWGIDHLWNIKLGNPTNKLAIIDDVIAIHTRPVGGGELYGNFDKKLSHAEEENYKIWKKYNLAKSSYDDLKNGKLFSVESFALNYHNTIEYSRVYRQLEAGVDVSDRFWPPSDYLKKLLTIEKLTS
jgi:hypothetical protein